MMSADFEVEEEASSGERAVLAGRRSQVDGLLCFFALLLESDWGCREQLATLCLGKTWGNKSTMILAEFPLISALCCMIHEI